MQIRKRYKWGSLTSDNQSYSNQNSLLLAKNKNIDQWNRIESRDINLCICVQLIYGNRDKNHSEKTVFSISGAGKTGQLHVKNETRISLQCKWPEFDPWIRKIPWRREWPPTPVFLPGEFHGQSSLTGYSLWGHKESDVSEQQTLSQHFHNIC